MDSSIESKKINDNQTIQVTGGSGGINKKIYNVGDKVKLNIYPEFGIGTVHSVYIKDDDWVCTVYFKEGIMDAVQYEFMPA